MKVNDDEDMNSCPSYSVFSPTCCKVHQSQCTKKVHMQTTEWRFEKDYSPVRDRNFDPWQRSMASTQCKQKCIRDIDESVDKERSKTLMEDFEKIKIEDYEDIPLSSELEPEPVGKEMQRDSNETESSEILENLKEHKVNTNPYLVLLNRLDEEEGVRTPSIEDKLKLAEDHLRISTAEFCKACEELIEGQSEDSPVVEKLLRPETVQEAFRPKVVDPSLRPPQTSSVSELKKHEDEVDGAKELKKDSNKRETKKKGTMKQGFYLPADTWFSQEKQVSIISSEELELLNSTSTKAFLKFLDERKKEPPKILQEIQKKLQTMQEVEKTT